LKVAFANPAYSIPIAGISDSYSCSACAHDGFSAHTTASNVVAPTTSAARIGPATTAVTSVLSVKKLSSLLHTLELNPNPPTTGIPCSFR
jgi:hypothetical protein